MGSGPRRPRWHVPFECLQCQCRASRVQRTGGNNLALHRSAAAVLLEHPLSQCAGTLIRVLLGYYEAADDLRWPSGPAEPESGTEDLGEGSGLQDHVWSQGPQARLRRLREAQLPVGNVLEDQEAIPAG